MNYQQKYIKYKQKFLFLQEQIAGGINYVKKLKELYNSVKFDVSLSQTYKYNTLYGEMDYAGISKINQIYKDIQHFVDIGSGRGKLCLYMAHNINIKSSIGIEIVEERHKDAIELKQELTTEFSTYTDKVEFIKADIFEVSIKDRLKGKTLVWFSNIAFEQEQSDNVIIKLIGELPKKSIIICNRQFSINHEQLNLLQEIVVVQSWNSESTVYSYQIS